MATGWKEEQEWYTAVPPRQSELLKATGGPATHSNYNDDIYVNAAMIKLMRETGGPATHSNYDDHIYNSVDIQLMKAYTDAIKDGIEQSRTVRLMVIGNGEVGKSSLIRNLIGEQQMEATLSTDGIEVHTCSSSDASGLWNKHEETATDFEADRLAHIVNQQSKNTNLFTSPNRSTDEFKLVEQQIPEHKTKTSGKPIMVEQQIKSSRSTFRKMRNRLARLFQRGKKEDKRIQIKGKTEPDEKESSDSEPHNMSIDSDEQIVSDIQLQSTNKHNVDEQPTISRTKMLRIRDHAIVNKTQETRIVKIWDFGGQFVYYATHQLFHSRHAVYLLVLDASLKLEDEVKDNQYPGKTTTKTVKQYCKFWMHSIQSYVGTENGDAPPVILVATHIDAVKGGWNAYTESEFFESVREIFDGTILANHIQPISFALSNTKSASNEFELLRNYIIKVADEQQSKEKLCQPARWIALETSIREHINKRHISLDELRRFDLKNEFPIEKHDQLLAFLKQHHSLGDLVYFDDSDLSETIIIDPQWIIDAFKSIISSKIFCRTNNYLRPKWKMLVEEAKLSHEFIDFVWNEEKNQDFKDNKEKLLLYMSKLGILSEVSEVDIDTGDVRYCDFYMVPSLLHNHMPGDVLEKLLESGTGTTTALVFVFDNQYVSPTLYHRLTAAALGKWKVIVSNKSRLLFDNIGVYELDTVHAGVIEMRDTSIEIRVINRCNGEMNFTLTDRLRRFVKLVIQIEYRRSGVSEANLFVEHIRCNLNNDSGDSTIPLSQLIDCPYASIPCPDNSIGHVLDLKTVQKEWQLLNAAKFELSLHSLANRTNAKRITERDINKMAQAMGKHWQALGLSLGLAKVETQRIELDSPNQTLLQIVNMLTKWSEKEGERATLAALIIQIRDTRHLGVNWDMINNIIDEQN